VIAIPVFVNGKLLNSFDIRGTGMNPPRTRTNSGAVAPPVLVAVLLLALVAQGCILIRTTEHRIQVRDDGSGEAVLRLIDLRSDEPRDSSVSRDFSIMISSFEKGGIEDFEKSGRKVTGKRFFVQGDTLIAEIAYTFPSLDAIEGLRVTSDEVFVVVNPGRVIARTNGSIESWENSHQRIVWDRDAKRIFFRISEQTIPPSKSLAHLYIEWMREH
jgi:hypothetical protein